MLFQTTRFSPVLTPTSRCLDVQIIKPMLAGWRNELIRWWILLVLKLICSSMWLCTPITSRYTQNKRRQKRLGIVSLGVKAAGTQDSDCSTSPSVSTMQCKSSWGSQRRAWHLRESCTFTGRHCPLVSCAGTAGGVAHCPLRVGIYYDTVYKCQDSGRPLNSTL